MRSPAELTELFRQRGLKVTPQRQCIFRVLYENASHPTAEAVHAAVIRELPTVSLRTVYQTLNELVDMGEIEVVDLGTGSNRFDPNLDGHHHLVCTECGRVQDLVADFPAVTVPDGRAHGYELSSVEIVFRGRCRECSGQDTSNQSVSTTSD